jgi:hypothetical protein
MDGGAIIVGVKFHVTEIMIVFLIKSAIPIIVMTPEKIKIGIIILTCVCGFLHKL